ncbi:MAG: LON peptidase substrate-binding domain-containing protein [Candidatus Binatus sp.]|uniref:LON peptidase substrate-binding domain-containing protein n=1 Tax=Candidatus Binatus sp. TaxID=2811406 RepID=UPI003BAEA5AE
MTTSDGPRKRLPNNPSEENLRKQAKRLAAQENLQLAAAQRRLAIEYGYRNWAELMRAVASRFVPLVPLRGLVAFPHEVYPIFIGRRRSLKAIEAAEDSDSLAKHSPILLVAQREAEIATPSPADMYQVGTLGVIAERHRLPDGTVKIVVEGKKRARVRRFVFHQKFFKAEAEDMEEASDRSVRVEQLVLAVLSAFHKYAGRENLTIPELATRMKQIEEDPSILSYLIAHHLKMEVAEQQALLECVNPVERLERIRGYLEAAN